MIQGYLPLGSRIQQELGDLERVVDRAEKALSAARRNPIDQDYYVDSAALNLHDFYAGLERVFQQIATTVDGDVPSGRDWHRELLRQMSLEIPTVRPPVLSAATIKGLDEFLRFRHVLRNIYAFSFDPERVRTLVEVLQKLFPQVKGELLDFISYVNQMGSR